MNNFLFSNVFQKGIQTTVLIAVLLFSMGPVGVGTVYAAPPSNDNFASAVVIPGIPFNHSASTLEATNQTGEPRVPVACEGRMLLTGEKTVWYRYQAATSRGVHVDTIGSNYDTFVSVWRGTSLNNLTYVGCDDDTFAGLQSDLVFLAEAGNTYYIQVAGYAGYIGSAGPVPQPNPGGSLQFHVTSFEDVPSTHWAWRFIEGLYAAGVTSGCSVTPLRYCPSGVVTRDQMAVFLLRAKHGATYSPPAVGASTGFSDVPPDYWAGAWIKQLAAEGITGGCAAGKYCPSNPVTREQMAVFLLKAKYGSGYVPPAATGVFVDVPATYWAARWIERLATEGITSGCGGGRYCPLTAVTRDQMAVFLDKTFGIDPIP